MAKVTFEFASLRYLNLWIDHDRKIVELVSSSNRQDQLEAISKCANWYSVQRNFGKKYDVDRGDDRYDPILEVLEQTNCEDFLGDPQQTVTEVAGRISKRYGEFCGLWETRYQESRHEIERACNVLPEMHKYVSDVEFSNRDRIAELASHEWFQRRVLDTFFWNQGG